MIYFKEPKDVTFEQISDYKEEFVLNNEIIHGAANITDLSVPEWVQFTEDTKYKESVTPGFVTAHTFFALDNDKIIGIINARHKLNNYLLNFGGHIAIVLENHSEEKDMLKRCYLIHQIFYFHLA